VHPVDRRPLKIVDDLLDGTYQHVKLLEAFGGEIEVLDGVRVLGVGLPHVLDGRVDLPPRIVIKPAPVITGVDRRALGCQIFVAALVSGFGEFGLGGVGRTSGLSLSIGGGSAPGERSAN
jgi:hypothetical protein